MVTRGFPCISGLYLLKRHLLADDGKSAAEEAVSISDLFFRYFPLARKVSDEGSNGIANMTFY